MNKELLQILSVLVILCLVASVAYAFLYESQTKNLTQTIIRKWLSGWDKRVKITIDPTDVDAPLSNFPVLIHLSSISGVNSDDVTFIFDELQSDANRKKIAVTTSDKVTQCYVEIESWNQASEEAWLWVKVPNISSTTETALYLYYDRDSAENTGYVGDTNSSPAENVWDSNYLAVYHLGQAPTGINYDSTSNNKDLSSFGSMTSTDLVGGKIGRAIDFDGTNDRMDSSTQITFESFTFEAWAEADTWSDWRTFVAPDGDARDFCTNAGRLTFWDGIERTIGPTLSGTDWNYVATRYDDFASTKRLRGFVNGALTSQTSNPSYGPLTDVVRVAAVLYFGSYVDFWNGRLDEIRISSIARSNAWIKASYESERDHLLVFSNEEIA